MACTHAVVLGRRAGYMSIAFASKYTGYDNPRSGAHVRSVYFSFSVHATVSAVKGVPILSSPRRYLNVLVVVIAASQLSLERKRAIHVSKTTDM